MYIDIKNAVHGNQAMASVLLLYYHLLRDGGFANDQTVYIDTWFNGFDYITIEVSPECGDEIDQQLLREGAVVALLCDLQDVIGEYENNFLSQPAAQHIVSALGNDAAQATMPELSGILELLQVAEDDFNHKGFSNTLSLIYDTYVVARFSSLVRQDA